MTNNYRSQQKMIDDVLDHLMRITVPGSLRKTGNKDIKGDILSAWAKPNYTKRCESSSRAQVAANAAGRKQEWQEIRNQTNQTRQLRGARHAACDAAQAFLVRDLIGSTEFTADDFYRLVEPWHLVKNLTKKVK